MRRAVLAALLALVGACRAPRGAEPSAPAVGFRSSWLFDAARTYRTAFDEGATYGAEPAPRPLLVLCWYPALAGSGSELTHAGYFELASAEPSLARLAPALASYARDVFVQQTLDAREEELDAAGRAALAELLATPSGARRDALPAAGPFPLVVYRSGAGSSFEDNAALCVHLARQGYVVVAGAFQTGDGDSFGIDTQADSARDMEFLA